MQPEDDLARGLDDCCAVAWRGVWPLVGGDRAALLNKEGQRAEAAGQRR